MKLYTKSGDKGMTSLYDGSKRAKGDVIFDVLGNIDELSSHIGLLCAKIQPILAKPIRQHYISVYKYTEIFERYERDLDNANTINEPLREIQIKLLDIGSNIAVIDPKKKERVPKITQDDVKRIEEWIDIIEKGNTKLTEFLLPGVHEKDAQSHVCRSVTRRAERSMWKLVDDGVAIDGNIMKYINRLSDFFFAFARRWSRDEDIKVSDIKKKLSSE
uniref:Cobalamin adenosyltransferase-like domain-containing protein n=1 Tax=viral metagenome TaxID=1070528 RepID=A0A6C0JQM0_9ZZZZ